MGLKTENYTSKSTGITLPKAYAVLKNLIIETDNRARAIFAVQASREDDPATMAYETAKTETETIKVYDKEKKAWVEKTEYGTLYGWQDDIVGGEEQ